MANIKEYTSRTSPGGPIAPPGRKASNAGEYIADGLTSLGQGIAQAGQTIQQDQDKRLKIKSDDEVLSMNTKLSELQSRYKVSWADTIAKADPNDSELSNRFLKSFDEEAGKLGDNLSTEAGKNYYRQNLSNIRSNFQESTAAGQAHLASVATKQNYIQSLNMSSAGLISDPTSFGSVKALHDSAIDHLILSGKLPSDKAQELRTSGNAELAQSYVRGWIRTSPEQAKSILASGQVDELLGGDTKKQLLGEIDSEVTSRRVDGERANKLYKEEIEKRHEANYDKALGALVEGSLNAKTVMTMDLAPKQKEHFIEAIKRTYQAPNSFKTNPEKVTSLFERMHLPDSDPRKIISQDQLNAEFRNGGMSFGDLHNLRDEFAKTKTVKGKVDGTQRAAAMAMGKAVITGGSSKDPKAAELYYQFQHAYNEQYEAGIKAGKTKAELTDPAFVQKVLKPFIRTPQQKLQDKITTYQSNITKATGVTKPAKRKNISDILKKRGLGD